MRVALDYRPALVNREGIGRYTRELVRALVALGHGPELGLFGWTLASRRTSRSELGLAGSGAHYSRLRFPSRWFPGLARLTGRGAEDFCGGAQLWHHTQPSLLPVRAAREVSTIFDCIYTRANGFLSDEAAASMTASARRQIERSRLVLVPSAYVRDELVATFGIDPARAAVALLGCDHALREPVLPRARGAQETILTVSRVDRRKNHVRMLRAFEIVLRARPGAHWIVAGPAGHGSEDFERALEASPARASVEWLRYVPEEHLGALHARAGQFWFTSLDEGFGLPPLEAMARGVPTISSTRASLPEVLGQGAVLLDAEDHEALAREALALAADRERARALAERGRARASELTWRACAEATWAAYARALT
ncbi:MAG: glycosyltransferase family 4 protein [Planctomycetes bacterium]|nr:glycosyltransferase family 4 protein [Planctomycetota bacterium]